MRYEKIPFVHSNLSVFAMSVLNYTQENFMIIIPTVEQLYTSIYQMNDIIFAKISSHM